VRPYLKNEIQMKGLGAGGSSGRALAGLCEALNSISCIKKKDLLYVSSVPGTVICPSRAHTARVPC
jgi:hypothetical protein